MSDDEIRWCKKDGNGNTAVSYTLLPVYHKQATTRCARTHIDGRPSEILTQEKLRQHRNCNRINRDISVIRRTCSDDSEQKNNHSTIHSSSIKSSSSFRLLNLCIMIVLHLICNELVTSVNCDELLDSVGARGHFTHTWAAHIPGGDEMAEKVADDHNMYLRGKVSQLLITFINYFVFTYLLQVNEYKLIQSLREMKQI